MPKPKPIVARYLFDSAEVVGDRHVVAITVGPDLNPVVLSLENSPDYRIAKGGASFAKNRADQPNDCRVHYWLDGQWFTVDIEPTCQNIHSVQPLGTEQWLLVRCRASGPTDRNAHVANLYGRITHSFHAGDGIEDVQVTADEKIWCSYFDEGVFSGIEMGQGGLVCLDSLGNKLFDYGRVAGQNDYIADCYALNVSGKHETWLYYYTDFPLVRLTKFQLANRWPRMPVTGAHAFAITSEHALFFGSYNGRHSLFKVDLPSRRVWKRFVISEEGQRIKPLGAFGRAHHLYLVTDKRLFLIDGRTCS